MPPKGSKAAKGAKGGKRKVGNSGSGVMSSSKLSLDVREPNQNSFAQFLATQPHLQNATDSISIFKELVPMKFKGKTLTLDSGVTILDWKPDQPYSNEGVLTFQKSGQESQVQAYQKTIPLINPYHWMRYGERPSEPFLWNTQSKTIIAPENQAYVDTIASALASKLRNQFNSPHFCRFYGAYRTVTNSYKYNLEEDLEEFRFTKWFWLSLGAGSFTLCVTEKSTGRRLSTEEVITLIKPDEEFLDDSSVSDYDDSDDDSDDNSDTSSVSSLSAESLSDPTVSEQYNSKYTPLTTLEETTTIGLETNESVHVFTRNRSNTPVSMSSASNDSNDSFTDEFTVFAEFKGMPVVQVFLEKLTGTMDVLLETSEFAPANTPEKETIWTAWLFQICSALSQLQSVLHLTHNDLHTNNVLWKPTDQEFLWYKDTKDQIWKVPTYGRIFSIIDYGRAIFTINGHTCISSDYDDNHDAAGMYNFGPIEDHDEPRVPPNKSFDLCRLTCSMVRALYPRNPVSKEKGELLTRDGLWEVRETGHPLFNILWSWLRTKSGGNVLETESGKEQYPGFELYSKIAAEVRGAVPSDQFSKPIFQQFRSAEIPSTTVQCIPLFL